MRNLSILALMGLAGASFAGTYFTNGALGAGDATWANPGGSTSGSAVQYYDAFQFTVDLTGNYTIEMASPNTSTSGTSNALDTYLWLADGTWSAGTPMGGYIDDNDDFTGALTVLPGPYAGTVLPNGTGFTGAQPASRLLNMALTANTVYTLVQTTYRQTDFVNSGSTAGATGNYYTGISGQGNIQAVPEPASMTALALGAVAMLRRRKSAK